MNIIPAIDILNGKCVRLTNGNFSTSRIYNENPLEVAKSFEDAGLKYLHLVDLDGARNGCVVNLAILENIARNTDLQIDFGGGLKTAADVNAAFNSGARQVNLGSMAVNDPSLFIELLAEHGSHSLILSADCRDRYVATAGWQADSQLNIIDYIKDYGQRGVEYVVCTDIHKDGRMEGPSIALYEEILAATPVKLVASGGITTFDDLRSLQAIGCDGAIIGKAIYERRISLKELADLC